MARPRLGRLRGLMRVRQGPDHYRLAESLAPRPRPEGFPAVRPGARLHLQRAARPRAGRRRRHRPRPSATLFRAGETLRLVDAGRWLWPRNPLTGQFPAAYQKAQGRCTLHSGPDRQARLLIPVIPDPGASPACGPAPEPAHINRLWAVLPAAHRANGSEQIYKADGSGAPIASCAVTVRRYIKRSCDRLVRVSQRDARLRGVLHPDQGRPPPL